MKFNDGRTIIRWNSYIYQIHSSKNPNFNINLNLKIKTLIYFQLLRSVIEKFSNQNNEVVHNPVIIYQTKSKSFNEVVHDQQKKIEEENRQIQNLLDKEQRTANMTQRTARMTSTKE